MSLCQDRQIKGFLLFLTLFALLFVGTATVLTIYQVNGAEALWLKHDEAVSSSLLEQGVPKEVIAVAFTNTDISEEGRSLLAAAGLGNSQKAVCGLISINFSVPLSAPCYALCYFSLCACRRNIRFFLEKEAIVSTGRQNIAKLHQRGLLLSFTAEL